jgi:hypothetical protein
VGPEPRGQGEIGGRRHRMHYQRQPRGTVPSIPNARPGFITRAIETLNISGPPARR